MLTLERGSVGLMSKKVVWVRKRIRIPPWLAQLVVASYKMTAREKEKQNRD